MKTKLSEKDKIVKNSIDEAKGFLKSGRSTKELLKAVRKEEKIFEQRKK